MTAPRVAALINARLLSSRLPRKMVLPFAGTTLIDIALQKLAALDFLHGRYFAVAEDELASRAGKYANITLLRRDPQSVQPGYNGNQKVFEHCRKIEAEYILWLNPCSPLLSINTIRSAAEQVISSRHNSYTSVVETTDWIFDQDGTPITNTEPGMISTAHSRKFYRVAHAFHVLNKATFLQNFVPWTLTRFDPALIPINRDESYDVNDDLEFRIAEAAYLRQPRA
jgi:CMP-N-acetylneuraminic acid synthetase